MNADARAVARVHDAPLVQADADSIMAVIARAANDPNTDVTKLERLLSMYERITASRAKADYFDGLAAMQIEMPAIVERGKIQIGTGKAQMYALWEDINDAIKPVLQRHGFALSFRTGIEDSKITVTGVLSHRGGHSEQTTIHLPSDTSGSKNAVQAVGSSTSYGKRYTAQALLNLTSRGEDDDGVAGGGGKISEKQAEEILALIESTNSDIEKLCKYYKVPAVVDIAAKDYDRVISALKTKGARK